MLVDGRLALVDVELLLVRITLILHFLFLLTLAFPLTILFILISSCHRFFPLDVITAAPVLSPATTGSAFSIFLSRVFASLWLLLRFVFPPFSFRSPGDLSVTAVGFVNERSSGGLPCRVVVVKSDTRFMCCATVESGDVSVSGCVVILTGVVVKRGRPRKHPLPTTTPVSITTQPETDTTPDSTVAQHTNLVSLLTTTTRHGRPPDDRSLTNPTAVTERSPGERN